MEKQENLNNKFICRLKDCKDNILIAFFAVLIGAEVFGYEYIPYFFAVCVIAYVFIRCK